ncbi:hypothetical protein LXL04_034761 [Taraxacum kok-saghyz]
MLVRAYVVDCSARSDLGDLGRYSERTWIGVNDSSRASTILSTGSALDSGNVPSRDAKSLSQPCMIEVADVKTLAVRHEYQSYTLEDDMCGVEHVGLSVLRLEMYIAVEYMARTRLIKADIMMTERVCLVSSFGGDWYVSHGCMQRC